MHMQSLHHSEVLSGPSPLCIEWSALFWIAELLSSFWACTWPSRPPSYEHWRRSDHPSLSHLTAEIAPIVPKAWSPSLSRSVGRAAARGLISPIAGAAEAGGLFRSICSPPGRSRSVASWLSAAVWKLASRRSYPDLSLSWDLHRSHHPGSSESPRLASWTLSRLLHFNSLC